MKFALCWMAMMLAAGALVGCSAEATDSDESGGGASEDVAQVEGADTSYTYHAIVTCQSAGLYANYHPYDLMDKRYDLGYGNRVGVRKDAGDSYAAVILDYGPNIWGFMLRHCLTRCWGNNNPIAGCF